MYLRHLSLRNFRNYLRLELTLPPGVTVVQGGNAQGKTNLLEAIVFLATSKSLRAQSDRELIHWLAYEQEPIPFAEVAGEVETNGHTTHLRLVLTQQSSGGLHPRFRKVITINGVRKRVLDLLGILPVVIFMPEDVLLIAGSPSLRRRYLNMLLCQVDREYCRHLEAYNKVVLRRNAQLRELQGRSWDENLLAYWDEALIEHGAYLIHRRQALLSRLDQLAREHHTALAPHQGRLRVVYRPSVSPSQKPTVETETQRPMPWSQEPVTYTPQPVWSAETWCQEFQAALERLRDEELAAGITLVGPHRDDMMFLLDGRDVRVFGSRGQQRTVALALKLAEVQVITETLHSSPILLLDDVMSELDAQRRHRVLDLILQVPQAILTTTDWSDFTPEFLARAQCLEVRDGVLTPISPVS